MEQTSNEGLRRPTSALVREQAETLATPRRDYGVLARMLFAVLDLVYGRERTLSKFKVLEIVARVPYQTWEHVAYIAITHTYGEPNRARRIFEFVREAREQQDNEQWHLLILEEMVRARGVHEDFFRFRVVPQLLAFVFYHVSWLLYVIDPALSHGLNADFEDHAEHEYMSFVEENPQLETEPFVSAFVPDYGAFASVADFLRNVAVDEREHKLLSLSRIPEPRFA